MNKRGQVGLLTTAISVGIALSGVKVDPIGAATAMALALMVMGWIQDDIDHRVPGTMLGRLPFSAPPARNGR